MQNCSFFLNLQTNLNLNLTYKFKSYLINFSNYEFNLCFIKKLKIFYKKIIN